MATPNPKGKAQLSFEPGSTLCDQLRESDGQLAMQMWLAGHSEPLSLTRHVVPKSVARVDDEGEYVDITIRALPPLEGDEVAFEGTQTYRCRKVKPHVYESDQLSPIAST